MSINYQAVAAQLVDDLRKYLAYLQSAYDYKITLHQIEQLSSHSWPQLLVYNYHQCAVCREIKSSSSAWKHCVERQYKVRVKAEIAPYIGTCFAGVTEAVFPIWDIRNQCAGFLCVSGYTQDRQMSMERARAVAMRYGLSKDRIREAVEKLEEHLPDLAVLSAQIAPAQSMLRMLFYFSNSIEGKRIFDNPREKLYHEILNFSNSACCNPDFSLKDVCRHFNISYSYASHLFSEFHESSFVRYVRNIRIEVAKRYLEHTMLPIIFTSAECGFSDSGYFSSVFKKETGFTPIEYRKKFARVEVTEEEIPLKLKYQMTWEEKEHGAENNRSPG